MFGRIIIKLSRRVLMKIIIVSLILLFLIHIYLHFMVNPSNYLKNLTELNQSEITNTVYFKLPFIIDGVTLYTPHFENYTKIEKNMYSKPYDTLTLLEPLVKFFTKNTIYKIKKKIPTHYNLECRNFYIIHSGSVKITLSHLDNTLDIDLKQKQILFVPNYWNVSILANEKSIVEKVQYSTIMNQFNFLWNDINTFL